ncbi:MAG TPA: hypothetical protein DC049_10230 [Spirochaetia bacterium]|nr:hypothetical protein [Spirochaetia bacterium]
MYIKKILLMMIMLFFFSTALYPEANLLQNGGFENDPDSCPPEGWVMWGGTQFKIPENYTRDQNNAKTGKYAFRIYHPENTAGYIITDPRKYPINPKSGGIYTVRFWARGDQPGTSAIWIASYKSIDPMVASRTIKSMSFDTEEDWKEYEYIIKEGIDFSAEESRIIYLCLFAAKDSKIEKTLWVDDFSVTESISKNDSALIDDAKIAYETLPLCLEPGDSVQITADASRVLRKTSKLFGGVSFHRMAGWAGRPYSKQGDYTLSAGMEAAIRDLHMPLTRVYALGDEAFSLEDAIDKFAAVLGKINVPQDTAILEFETQGASSKLPPEKWMEGVNHSLEKGYKFRYWEIGNETYKMLWNQGGAFPTPDDYIKHLKNVSAAIKKVHPAGKIGVSILAEHPGWGNYILKQAAGYYDFVVPHWYGMSSTDISFEETVLGNNHAILCRALQINELIKAYNPGKDVFQYDSEWGMSFRKGEKADYNFRNANIYGVVYRAVRLIYYTREKIIRGATSWELFTKNNAPGFGIFATDAENKRSMNYWLYYYYNRHIGDNILDIKGKGPYYKISPEVSGNRIPNQENVSVPFTPALITASPDKNEIYIMIVNGSWSKNFPCSINLENCSCSKSEGVILDNPNPDAHPMIDKKDDLVKPFAPNLKQKNYGFDLEFTLPAHSVVFITLKK